MKHKRNLALSLTTTLLAVFMFIGLFSLPAGALEGDTEGGNPAITEGSGETREDEDKAAPTQTPPASADDENNGDENKDEGTEPLVNGEEDETETPEGVLEEEGGGSPSFAYSEQPGSPDDIAALVANAPENGDDFFNFLESLPKWAAALEDEWLPSGWAQFEFVDEATGASYWRLVPNMPVTTYGEEIEPPVFEVINFESFDQAMASDIGGILMLKADFDCGRKVYEISGGKSFVIKSANPDSKVTVNNVSFNVKGESSLTLEGLNISNTLANPDDILTPRIRLVSSDASTIHLNNISFTDGNYGRSVYAANGTTLYVTGCEFSGISTINDRHLVSQGGVIEAVGLSQVFITDSSIHDNKVRALYLNGSSAVVDGSHFYNNSIMFHGGAIYAQKSSELSLVETTVENNYSQIAGGGIYIKEFSTLNITSSYINGNKAGRYDYDGMFNGEGGGIYCINASTINFNSGEINGNTAFKTMQYSNSHTGGRGGGICFDDYGNTFNMTGGTINNNNDAAYNPFKGEFVYILGGSGGGFYAYSAPSMDKTVINISGGEINNNSAAYGGGAYARGNIELTIKDTTVDNNKARWSGGLFLECPSQIIDSSVSGNTASEYGGAIVHSYNTFQYPDWAYGELLISNSKINNNTVDPLTRTSSTIIPSSFRGAGIFLEPNANLVVNGGSQIQGNKFENCDSGTTYGGAIFASSGSKVELSGKSAVKENSANYGGGIFIDDSSYKESGPNWFDLAEQMWREGLIEDLWSFPIEMYFEYRKDNPQLYGIVNQTSLLTIKDASVSNNSASVSGGGILISAGGQAELLDSCEVKGNSAVTGGGIYILQGLTYEAGPHAYEVGELLFEQGLIEESWLISDEMYESFKEDNPHLYKTVDLNSLISVKGASILNNSASELGGGVYLCDAAEFEMSGGSVSGNTAMDGGGIYSTADNYENIAISGGSFSANNASEGYEYFNSQENPSLSLICKASAKNLTSLSSPSNSASLYDFLNSPYNNYDIYYKSAQAPSPVINELIYLDNELSGAGIPGAGVTVTWPGGTTGTATVSGDGSWSLELPAGMIPDSKVSAVQDFGTKNTSAPADESMKGFTVTYVPAVGNSYTNYVRPGSVAQTPGNTQQEGHRSSGWWTQASGGNRWQFGSDTVQNNITLYEQHILERYTVFYYDSEDLDGPKKTQDFYFRERIESKTPTVARPGFEFVGWNILGTSTPWDFANGTMPSHDLDLVAVWREAAPEPTPVPTLTPVVPVAPSAAPTIAPTPSPEPEATPEPTPEAPAPTAPPVQPEATAGADTAGDGTGEGGPDDVDLDFGDNALGNFGGDETVNIFGKDVPLGGILGKGAGWSLINLILVIIAMASATISIAKALKSSKQAKAYGSSKDNGDEFLVSDAEYAKARKANRIMKYGAAALGGLMLILFFILENFSYMQIFSVWTPLFLVMFVAHIILTAVSGKSRSKAVKQSK